MVLEAVPETDGVEVRATLESLQRRHSWRQAKSLASPGPSLGIALNG
jgi:hypothetical protein